MKTIGMIGGTSWVSTIDYYRIINATTNERLGGNESAKIILHSVNYGEIAALTKLEDWDAVANIIIPLAVKAERAGADCLLFCANTMHIIADRLKGAISIPFIHIAAETANSINRAGISSVLLLGTRYTMYSKFYDDILTAHGIKRIIPDEDEVRLINDRIYNEMGKGIFTDEIREEYLDIISRYAIEGVEGVVFGCTEIPILLRDRSCPIPSFDTLAIHATAAVDFALMD